MQNLCCMKIQCGSGLAREWGSTVYLKHPGERVNIAAFVRTTR
ncbi:hypothetical protein PS928_05382 [Pseudomonas fluorescens]|jgi:hypothetical protein|uniref:Uncharacterized protein n=1 Tax=Pseudomonas fluorescens TaxID=294 RepID=A0A5E7VJ69_PSEFL|nr:hypothetical protein PS928_05382 [Pseudomonas fluorescens]